MEPNAILLLDKLIILPLLHLRQVVLNLVPLVQVQNRQVLNPVVHLQVVLCPNQFLVRQVVLVPLVQVVLARLVQVQV